MKAVLFDLDGTLLDTVEDIRACVNYALRARSYPELTREQTCSYIGDGAKKLVERALPAGATDLDECYELFLRKYSKNKNEHTKLFTGEEKFLEQCRASGLKLGIVTNKPQEATETCVRQFFKIPFDFVGGDSGAFPCKPDPTLAIYAALTMRVAPAECLFVGDGEADVLTAKNAGMKCVSVLWGYRTKEQLSKAGAKNFVNDFNELGKIILDNFSL